jgi:hypothetical protein
MLGCSSELQVQTKTPNNIEFPPCLANNLNLRRCGRHREHENNTPVNLTKREEGVGGVGLLSNAQCCQMAGGMAVAWLTQIRDSIISDLDEPASA